MCSIWEQARKSLGEAGGDLAGELERMGLHDWEREVVLEIDAIENDSAERYRSVDAVEPWQGYHDMEEFIGGLEDESLQERLWSAIRGRGAFRRFKDVVGESDDLLDDWYAFSNARERERVMGWLEEEGIEAIPRKTGGPAAGRAHGE
jgi:hypothetical protein